MFFEVSLHWIFKDAKKQVRPRGITSNEAGFDENFRRIIHHLRLEED